MTTVICRLPHGLVINHPDNYSNKVLLNGANQDQRFKRIDKDKIILLDGDYGVSEVADDFWAAWIKANDKHPAVLSGAIIGVKGKSDADKVAEEVAKEKTGFEGMKETAEVTEAAKG